MNAKPSKPLWIRIKDATTLIVVTGLTVGTLTAQLGLLTPFKNSWWFLVVIAVGMILGGRVGLWRHEKTEREIFGDESAADRLRRRVRLVNHAVGEATEVMDELRRDLAAQQAAREALLAQAEEQQRLLAVDHEQAEKIRQVLVGESRAAAGRQKRRDWMFYGLGVLTSVPIGVAINLLVPGSGS